MFNRVYRVSLLEAEMEVLSSEIGGRAEKNRGSTNPFSHHFEADILLSINGSERIP
jgi:hypothetical protein